MPTFPEGTFVKPIRGAPDVGFLAVAFGRSTSASAESGVTVTFTTPFTTAPVVVIGQHIEKEEYVDPDSVTVSGFTWYSTQAEASIDWIAVGT